MFDCINGFTSLSIGHWLSNAASKCNGFKVATTASVTDGNTHALHFSRVDDVFQAVGGASIAAENTYWDFTEHTVTKHQSNLVVGSAGCAVDWTQFYLLFCCGSVYTFHIFPFPSDGAHVVQLVQPTVFVVDTFYVDVHCSIADTLGQVEVCVDQGTLLERKEITSVGTSKAQLIVTKQDIEWHISTW